MLSAHARIPDENQDEPSRVILDIADADVLKKFRNTFGSIAATLASPAGDGDVARHASNACLKRHGLHWIDVVNGFCDHQSNGGGDMAAANATIEHLLTQVAEQQAEIDQLRAERASGNAQALWSSVGVKPSDTARIAHWALDLHARMYVGISQWEADFLHDATQWPIRPSPARQEKLDQIIGGVVRRTKQTPPP